MNTSKRHRTACVFTPCAPTVWRKYKRSVGHHHRMRFCLSSKLSREGRSDNLSKRRPSRLSRSGFIGFSSENDPTCSEKTSPKNECLGKRLPFLASHATLPAQVRRFGAHQIPSQREMVESHHYLRHLTDLAGKPKGESSMSGKRLNRKVCTARRRKSCVQELPQGIEAKPGLAEP